MTKPYYRPIKSVYILIQIKNKNVPYTKIHNLRIKTYLPLFFFFLPGKGL